MLLFVELMGVTTSQLSPFCKVFNTLTELKETYVMYCPKTFTYNDAVGKEDEEDVEPEVDEDSGEQTKAAYVAAKIKEFADEMMRLLMMLMMTMMIRAIWRMISMMMVV